ncbi:MAG: DJ-1/PfpI family protein [Spirochaetales bacterium]|nr:DJ-1/PfpI family protein [Spirochaetales bacterium]
MKYCVMLHNNFEDIEATSFIDLLRRVNVELDVFGIGGKKITSRSKITYLVEHEFLSGQDISVPDYAGILIPGGPGVYALTGNQPLLDMIKKFYDAGKLVFAICAAPLLLDKAGILEGKSYTCYPGTEIESGNYISDDVVVDGTVITSQGVGTALKAALKLVEIIVSKEEAGKQGKAVLF